MGVAHSNFDWYAIVDWDVTINNDNAYIFGKSGWTSCKDEGAMDVLLTRWCQNDNEIAKLTWNLVDRWVYGEYIHR